MKGWELVERRGDGLWWATSRSYEEGAITAFKKWLTYNAQMSQRFHVRPVTEADPPLAASRVRDPHEGEDEPVSLATQQAANKEGEATALALVMLFGKPDPNSRAVFTLGRRFARFAGYDDSDDSFSYLEGFVQGFQDASANLTPTAIESANPLRDGNVPWTPTQ